MRPVQIVLLVLCSLFTATVSTAQEPARLALLIGNQGYNANVGPLKNPHNDIRLIGAALDKLGFKTTLIRDADYRSVDAAIKRHVATVRREGQGTISFVYYSGHGAADPDTKINYLIPVDVANADDDELWNFSLNLNTVVEGLRAQAPGATHYVVFDACRNELNLRRKGQKALTDKGFVPIAYTPGVMVAYATAPGRTASDIGSDGGTYAKALADEIVKPGVDSMLVFSRVARRVQREIGQDPFLSASTMPEVYFAGDLAASKPTSPKSEPPQRLSEAAEAWDRSKDTTSLPVLEAFIRRFGDTFYGDLAKARLAELKQQADAAQQVAKKKAEDDARAKEEAERKRLALLQQEDERKRTEAEAARKRADAAGAIQAGSVFRDCPECPEMVVVPGGDFMMGSPFSEEGRVVDEGPQHKVTIAKPFAVGKFEVTFAEWAACVAGGGCTSTKNPDDGAWGRGKRPVINVSWDDATQYAAWLSKKTGKTYRLPTEAEWEYAARGVTKASAPHLPFATGATISTDQANYNGITLDTGKKGVNRGKTVEVGSFPGNAFGLHDMHGNVWEWVQDCYNDSYTGAPTDGSAVKTYHCALRVLRGGSWFGSPLALRSAHRNGSRPGFRSLTFGFRVARTL